MVGNEGALSTPRHQTFKPIQVGRRVVSVCVCVCAEMNACDFDDDDMLKMPFRGKKNDMEECATRAKARTRRKTPFTVNDNNNNNGA